MSLLVRLHQRGDGRLAFSRANLLGIATINRGRALYRGCMLRRDAMRFRGGLVFKARRLVYHSSLGRENERKKKNYSVEGLGGWLGRRQRDEHGRVEPAATTSPHDPTKSTNLEWRSTLTATPKRGFLSIYLTDLYRGVIIPVFENQSIGRRQRDEHCRVQPVGRGNLGDQSSGGHQPSRHASIDTDLELRFALAETPTRER